jgi:hypothetical protein
LTGPRSMTSPPPPVCSNSTRPSRSRWTEESQLIGRCLAKEFDVLQNEDFLDRRQHCVSPRAC